MGGFYLNKIYIQLFINYYKKRKILSSKTNLSDITKQEENLLLFITRFKKLQKATT